MYFKIKCIAVDVEQLITAKAFVPVVAQFIARSLPIPDDPGSNPVVCNFY